ncbi:hypothetical protein [Lacrimispora sp.]|uniref:hypothetical protein n=1 Tax=Lacrimispora sp. TaxID=2719234 RepID=UPI0029E44E02|nr:hypothetical protein [Lacrimispora sp.]
MKGFRKKFVNYNRPEVYAVIYGDLRLVFYNACFMGETKLFVMAPRGKEVPHAEVL